MSPRKAFVLVLTVASALLAAESPPEILGLKPITQATRQRKPDPVDAAAYQVIAAFELPVPADQQRRIALTRLAALIHSKSASDRQAAAFANAEIGTHIDPRIVLDTLRTLLADRAANVRLEALLSCIGCTGLGRIAIPALPQITPLITDPDPEVRRCARMVVADLKKQNPK